MHISENGLKLIKKWEGCYLRAYQDCIGVWTIGYGVTNADRKITNTKIRPGLKITQGTADAWLKDCIRELYEPKVNKYWEKYHWNQNQYDALVSFCYNIGNIDGLTNNGKRSNNEIAAKMLEYCKAGGRYVKGLYERRKDERALFYKECAPAVNNQALLSLLAEYHVYIKKHSKSFINKYDSGMTTFDKAKAAIKAGKKVSITCVGPLRWALAELGIKDSKGKSLISAPDGSFEKYYSIGVRDYFKRITSGGPIGMDLTEAIDKKLLVAGDIVAYEGHTHTSVYSGEGYKFYEGGGSCVVDGHYPKGILLDYSKNSYKNARISEVLRFKPEYVIYKTEEEKKEEYDMLPILKKGVKADGRGVYAWQAIVGVKVDGNFGSKTEAATKEFQKKYNLTVDGIVGKFTWSAGLGTL